VESLGRVFVEERQTISLSHYIREMDERRAARAGPVFRALTPEGTPRPIVTRRSVVTFDRRVGGDTPIGDDDVPGAWEDRIIISHPAAPPVPIY
jgi:hypothetical protein